MARALALVLIAWLCIAGEAYAACAQPTTATVNAGGSVEFHCSDGGFIFRSGAAHGTVDDTGTPSDAYGMTYTHNGDSATSDTFVANDGNRDVTFNITIVQSGPQPLTITTAALPNMAYNTAYNQTVQASGGTGQIHFTMTGQPRGIVISDAGVISGTPTQSGTFTLAVHASDSASTPQTADKNFTVAVSPANITVNPGALNAGTYKQAYAQATNFSATGGIAPYTYAVSDPGNLPPGLSLSGSALTGTPTAAGNFTFTVQATDANGQTGTRLYTLNIASVAPSAPTNVSAVADTGAAGTQGNATVSFTPSSDNGGAPPLSYTVTSNPGGLTATGSASPITIGNLTRGTSYTFIVTARNANNQTANSPSSAAVTPRTNDTVTIQDPGTLNYGDSPTLVATTASNSPVTFASNTPQVCTITTGGKLTLLQGGTCTVSATSSGNAAYASGTATRNLTVNATAPGAPTNVQATTTTAPENAVTGTASVAFTVPASNGGSAITQYTIVSAPGNITATGAGSPIVVTGLTFGTTYTFTVTAQNAQGSGPGGSSNAVTPNKAQSITFNNPGTQNFGTTPTLTATSSSGLPVTLTSTTPSVCTIVGGNQLNSSRPGTCTIQATQAGNGAFAPAQAVNQTFSIVVQGGAVQIDTASLPPASYGTAYSQTIAVSGGAQPYTYQLTGALPPGITFANGTFSGTPTSTGAFSIHLTVTDQAQQTADRDYTLTVGAVQAGAPSISGLTPVDADPGVTTGSVTVSFVAPANNGGSPITGYVVTPSNGGPVTNGSGSPITVTGLTLGTGYTFTVHAVNGQGAGPESTAAGPVTPMGKQTIAFTNPGSRNFGETVDLQANATSGLTVTFVSQTPNVCTMTSATQVKGIAPGTCTVRASQAGNGAYRAANAVDQSFAILVPGGAVTITTASIPAPTRGVAYSQSIAASGGAQPYTFTESGALPNGLTFANGTISGTPTQSGSYAIQVTVTDQASQQDTKNYNFTVVVPPLTFTPATLPAGKVGIAYPSTTIAAAGGIAPYTYAVTAGALPVGLAMSPAGVVSGTPTKAGSYPVTVTATDAYGETGDQAYTVTVGEATPVAVDDSATVGANGSVTVPVTANDTGGPATGVTVSQPPGHGSTAVSGLNVVYTPAHDFFGTDTFRYTATGPGGTSNAATVSVTVSPGAVPTATAHKATVLAGKPVTIHAAEGATNGPFTAATVVDAPSSGSVQVQGTDLVYTPAADATGDITFSYTLSNAFGASQPAQVTVTVNPLPVAPPVSAAALQGRRVRVNLTSNARGGPFTGANVVSVSPANAGTTNIESAADGYTLVFEAAPAYAGGTVQIAYTLSNAYATSAPGYVTVTVTARPDPSKDPEVLGVLSAQADATRRMAVGQISNFQRRLEMLHSGGTSGFTNGITMASSGMNRGRDAYADLRDAHDENARRYLVQPNADSADATANATAQHGTLPGDVSVWTGGAVNFGKNQLGGSGNGTDFTTSGLSVGVDKQFSDKLAVGAGVGYGHDNSDVGNNGSRSAVDSYNVALYGSYRPAAAFYIDALAGYQWLSFDSHRFVTADGNRVTGSRDGKQWFASISAGYNHVGDNMQFTPYGRFDVARARLDAFTEHGDEVYSLDYRSQTVKTATATVGVLAQWSAKRDYGVWAPQLRAEFGHDMQGSSQAAIRYADMLDGPLYRATLYQQSRNHTLLGAGIVLQTNSGWMIRAEYQNQLDNTSRDNQSILLGVEKKFGP